MLVIEDLLRDAVWLAKNRVDLFSFLERLPAPVNRKYRIAHARFDEETTRRNQARKVIHFKIIQHSRHVVIDTMRQAHYAISKSVEITAHHSNFYPLIERRRKERHRSSSRNPHRSDSRTIDLRPRHKVINRPPYVPHSPTNHCLTKQERRSRRRLAR